MIIHKKQAVREFLLDFKWIIIAFLLFFTAMFAPTPEGLPVVGKNALAVFGFAVILWVTQGLPLGATSLLATVLLVLVGVTEGSVAFLVYGSEPVFFLIGAFMLATGIMKHNLHKRIALKMLDKFGKNPTTLLLGVIVTSGFLSMLIPAHAVAALLLPVLVGVMASFGVFSLFKSNFSKSLFLGMAYGCSIGSIVTYMGGARNLLAVSILKESTGLSVGFLQWIIAAIPIAVIMWISAFFVIKQIYPIERSIGMNKAKQDMYSTVKKMGDMTLKAKTVMIIFVFTVLMYVFASHELGLGVISILSGSLLFLTKSITWEDFTSNTPWHLIFLYGGAISLGQAMTQTGAAQYIADVLTGAVGSEVYTILLIFVVLSIFLTEVITNLAVAATLMPIGIGAMNLLNISPMVAIFIIAIPSGLSFMFIIGTPGNAIAYSSGYVGMKDFVKAGIALNIIGIITIMTIGVPYWNFLGYM